MHHKPSIDLTEPFYRKLDSPRQKTCIRTLISATIKTVPKTSSSVIKSLGLRDTKRQAWCDCVSTAASCDGVRCAARHGSAGSPGKYRSGWSPSTVRNSSPLRFGTAMRTSTGSSNACPDSFGLSAVVEALRDTSAVESGSSRSRNQRRTDSGITTFTALSTQATFHRMS